MRRPLIRLTALGLVSVFASAAWAVETAAPAAAPSSRGQVRGTVFYGRHLPAVGVVIMVLPEKAATPVYAATTGANGSFAFGGVADGTYRAEVRRDGYATVAKSGIVVRAPFRAVVEVLLEHGDTARAAPPNLEGSAALAGIVRIASGAPLAEARVNIVRPDAADDPRTMLTDAAGAFTFGGLKAGRWRVEVVGAGLLPLRTELDLQGDVAFDVSLAQQPANYQPLPQDLIVPEDVIPPKKK